jgi:hypothetical protein
LPENVILKDQVLGRLRVFFYSVGGFRVVNWQLRAKDALGHHAGVHDHLVILLLLYQAGESTLRNGLFEDDLRLLLIVKFIEVALVADK